MSETKLKTWEIRISTGNTNAGEVGLAFSFQMEGDEQPTPEAVLAAAKEHLERLNDAAVEQSTDDGPYDIVLFTESSNLTVNSISEIGEIEPDELDCNEQYFIMGPDGKEWREETTCNSDQGAWDLWDEEVLPEFERQGYYKTAAGEIIPVADLKARCKCQEEEADEPAKLPGSDPTGIATEATEKPSGTGE